MRVELQGTGTYSYNCDRPGCYYCALIGRKVLPVKTLYELRMETQTERNKIYEPKIVHQPEVFIRRTGYSTKKQRLLNLQM